MLSGPETGGHGHKPRTAGTATGAEEEGLPHRLLGEQGPGDAWLPASSLQDRERRFLSLEALLCVAQSREMETVLPPAPPPSRGGSESSSL